MGDVEASLIEIGLSQYLEVFEDSGVDLRSVAELNEDGLKDLGVKLGNRRLMQRANSEQAPDKLARAVASSLRSDAVPSTELSHGLETCTEAVH